MRRSRMHAAYRCNGPNAGKDAHARTNISSIGQLGVFLLHDRILFLAGHVRGKTKRGNIQVRTAMNSTPDGEKIRPPFGRQTGDGVRPEDARRKFVSDFNVIPIPLAVAKIVQSFDVLELLLLQVRELRIRPFRILGRRE